MALADGSILTLVRHGHFRYNDLSSYSDVNWDIADATGLSVRGMGEARRLANHLREISGVWRIYTSPLKRALETASIIAASLGVPVEEEPALAEVRACYRVQEGHTAEMYCTEVELEAELAHRASLLEGRLQIGSEFNIFVSHGLFIRAYVPWLLGIRSPGRRLYASPATGSITTLKADSGALEVLSYGCVPIA